ncbi:predicted protein [Plenodomus lingam JN3]|uniref:Predicted protein n=1 Tax=Leptosphaeria maculans (strain JN3 / isolate v23.1.3 / race Av1-4-5-6-7-8) TaxID=985895 RepID=E4ZPY3_LEPMJ|nr:predicted protein [Plenodomus lingam JN3]CBX93518.1 predicted protein [Plenodomus lingam JN3]
MLKHEHVITGAPNRTEPMIDEYTDYSYDSFDVEVHLGLFTDLKYIPSRSVKYLNLTTPYVPSWGCDSASAKSIRIGEKTYSVEVHAPKTTDLLGFIEFKYDKTGYCDGGLKMANFDATLHYHHLAMGETTKARDKGQTRQHGGGMKLSALVFRREGYSFRIESGSFRWNSIFKKGELACQLTRMGNKNLAKLKITTSGQPKTTIAYPWKDVCQSIAAI